LGKKSAWGRIFVEYKKGGVKEEKKGWTQEWATCEKGRKPLGSKKATEIVPREKKKKSGEKGGGGGVVIPVIQSLDDWGQKELIRVSGGTGEKKK